MTSTRALDVRAYPIDDPQGSTLAFASVALDGVAAIRGIRVVDSEKGVFVSMPQSKDRDGNFRDIAFPLDGDLRKELSDAVLEEFVYQAGLDPNERGYEKPELDAGSVRGMEDIDLEVRVFLLKKSQGNTVAYASVGFKVDGEDLMAIRGIRVVKSNRGLFVSMPQSKDKEGGFHDVAFPLISDLRTELNKAVLAEYDNEKTTSRSDRRKGLDERLAAGAEKVAQQKAATPGRTDVAKSRASALE